METGVIEVENRTRVLNGGKQIALQHSLFYKDALVFDNLKSRSVKLYSQKSGRGVKMDFAGFDYFGVWSAVNDAPYVCLEPWTGCATCTDEDDVLANKRGMCMLQVGNERRSAFSVTLL